MQSTLSPKMIMLCDSWDEAHQRLCDLMCYLAAFIDNGKVVFVSLSEYNFSDSLPLKPELPLISYNGLTHYYTKFSKADLLELASGSTTFNLQTNWP